MSKPIQEPSQGSKNSYLGWTDRQLERRPPAASAAAGDCGEYTWAVGVMNAFESTTTTVLTPGGAAEEIEVPDVYPMNFSSFGFDDSAAYTYDNDFDAITILESGIYDITLQGAFTREDTDPFTFLCNYNRYIEFRIGAKVEFVDYATAIPRTGTPWDGFFHDTQTPEVMSIAGQWAPPDTGLYMTMGLKVSARIVYDPDFYPFYDGTTVQCFYSHDSATAEPSLYAVLQIARLCGTPVPPTLTV